MLRNKLKNLRPLIELRFFIFNKIKCIFGPIFLPYQPEPIIIFDDGLETVSCDTLGSEKFVAEVHEVINGDASTTEIMQYEIPFRRLNMQDLCLGSVMKSAIATLAYFILIPAYADTIYHNPPSEEGVWPYTRDLPSCEDGYVLRKIMYDFENRERQFWASSLFINKFQNIEEIGLRNYGLSYTPRRFCKSEAMISDGVRRSLFYNITPDQSEILTGQVIDWCIVGLDRAHVDGPNCRRVTPY